MAVEDLGFPQYNGEEEIRPLADPVVQEEDAVEEDDTATLADRLRSVRDGITEHPGIAAAAVVGAGAVAAAAIFAKKKGWLSTPEGNILSIVTDRHHPDTVSVVETPVRGKVTSGLAASFPVSEAAVSALRGSKAKNSKELFAMKMREFAYPLRDGEEDPFYEEATKKVAGWLANALVSRNSKEES